MEPPSGGSRRSRASGPWKAELRSALATTWPAGRTAARRRTDRRRSARRGAGDRLRLAWTHPAGELQRALNALLPDDICLPGTAAGGRRFSSALPRPEAVLPLPRVSGALAGSAAGTVRAAGVARAGRGCDGRGGARSSGKKDFGAFGSAPREGSHTVRTVLRAEWLRQDDDAGILDRSGRIFVPHGAHDYGDPVAGGKRADAAVKHSAPCSQPRRREGRLRPHRLTDCA